MWRVYHILQIIWGLCLVKVLGDSILDCLYGLSEFLRNPECPWILGVAQHKLYLLWIPNKRPLLLGEIVALRWSPLEFLRYQDVTIEVEFGVLQATNLGRSKVEGLTDGFPHDIQDIGRHWEEGRFVGVLSFPILCYVTTTLPGDIIVDILVDVVVHWNQSVSVDSGFEWAL